MKTICVDARMGDGGVGTYLDHLLGYLGKTDWSVCALVRLSQRWDHSGIKPIVLDAPIYSFKEQCLFSRKIPPCALFWSPHYNVPLLPIRAKRRLTTIHDVYPFAFYSQLTLAEKTYASVLFRAAVRYSDKLVTVSEFSRAELATYLPASASKIQVIHSGVRAPVYSDVPVSFPKRFLLFVGNLKPHKNLQNLVRAFRLLQDEDLDLVLIGKMNGFRHSEDPAHLLELAGPFAHRIHFWGTVSNAVCTAAYERALALVFPSFYEGFGFPPLEAMSLGCPAVVSPCGSLPEVCGEAAYVVDPHSAEDIARGIRDVLHNATMRQDLETKGRAQSRRYNWDTCGAKYLSLIEELIGT